MVKKSYQTFIIFVSCMHAPKIISIEVRDQADSHKATQLTRVKSAPINTPMFVNIVLLFISHPCELACALLCDLT